MGKAKIPQKVKLIAGFIFKDEGLIKRIERILSGRFGKIDFNSRVLDFTHTDYYEREFGKNLKRKFISFKELIRPQELPRIKILANRLEEKLSQGANRLINIDPGYLDLSKFILATTKDYSHRIYLDKGIFAEITLSYQDKTFTAQDWTYPDYRSADYIAIFNEIREIYAQQIKPKK